MLNIINFDVIVLSLLEIEFGTASISTRPQQRFSFSRRPSWMSVNIQNKELKSYSPPSNDARLLKKTHIHMHTLHPINSLGSFM